MAGSYWREFRVSEFLVRSVQFRVTLVQNNRGSGHRLNNGTGVIFGMIFFFSDGLLLSVSNSNRKSSTLLKCHNQKYILGVSQSKLAAGIFFKRGFKFYRGWLAWVIYLNVHTHLNENDF